MLKTIFSVVAGFFTFFAIMYGIGFVMRMSWPHYAAVAEAMNFSLLMLLARLAIGVVAALAAGHVAARLATKPKSSAIAVGIVLVVFFLPVHVTLWDSFPIWYHLIFLVSLIPLTAMGARLRGSSAGFPLPSGEG